MKNKILLIIISIIFPVCMFGQTYMHTEEILNQHYNMSGLEQIQMLRTDSFDIRNGIYVVTITTKQKHGGIEILNIKGRYKNDLPDGQWVYSLNRSNFDINNRFYTTTINLNQNWKDGKPNGQWVSSFTSKFRVKIANIFMGATQWSDYTFEDSFYKTINWKDGFVNGKFDARKTINSAPYFTSTFKNDQIIFLRFDNIRHEFTIGDYGYVIVGTETFSNSWETDYYLRYTSKDMEVIQQLNSGVTEEELNINIYNDVKTIPVVLPVDFFADNFFDYRYGISKNILHNKQWCDKKLKPYKIYKYNTAREFKKF